jgi:hypothetical protein
MCHENENDSSLFLVSPRKKGCTLAVLVGVLLKGKEI